MKRALLVILCLTVLLLSSGGSLLAEHSPPAEKAALEMLEWLVNLKDWPGVVDEADTLIERGECTAACYEVRGLACLSLSRFRQAQESLEIVRESRPDDRRIAGLLGLSVAGQAESAIDEGRNATARELFSTAADLLGEASLDPSASEALLRSWASALAGAERSGEEISAIRALIGRVPGDAEARLRLALLLKQQGELDQARAALEAAPVPTAELDTALFNVAVQMFQSGRLDDSEAVTSALLERNPDHAPSCRLRGFTRYRKDGIDAALKDLRRYLELAPDTPEAAQIRKQLADLGR